MPKAKIKSRNSKINKTAILCSALLFAIHTRSADAAPFDESKGASFYDKLNPINRTLGAIDAMSVDDYIIALSQTSAINFIADVTHLSTEDWVQPFPSSPVARKWKVAPNGIAFYNLLGDFEYDKNLSDLHYDEATYLFWNKPDALETALLIVAEGKQSPVESLPNEFDLFHALDEYTKQPLKWREYSGKGNVPFHRVKLGEVPLELRNQVKALAKHEILHPDLRRELLLTDGYWQTARVRVSAARTSNFGEAQVKQPPIVLIYNQDENGQVLPALELTYISSRNFHFTSGITSVAIGMNTESVYDRSNEPRAAGRPRNIGPDDLAKAPLSPQPAPAEFAVVPGLSGAQLELEAALQAKVSSQVKRRPLSELLAEVAKKNGVTLGISQGVPAKTLLVTARVSEMPLGTLMGAIARVYGLSWTKQEEKKYTLNSVERSALETAMLRRGRGGDFLTSNVGWGINPEQTQELQELEQEVADSLEGKGADKPGGVAFSEVPEDLQLRVRQAVENVIANQLASEYQVVTKLITDEAVLEISRRTYPNDAQGSAEWTVKLQLPAPVGKASYGPLLTKTVLYAPPAPIPPQNENPIPPAG